MKAATLRFSPVQSHGKSQHRALAGTAARSHVNNLGWSAATPEDVPRWKTAAAAQPHCLCQSVNSNTSFGHSQKQSSNWKQGVDEPCFLMGVANNMRGRSFPCQFVANTPDHLLD